MTSFQLGTTAEVPRHGKPMRHVWLVTPETQIDIGLQAVIDLARSNGVPMLGLRGNVLDALQRFDEGEIGKRTCH